MVGPLYHLLICKYVSFDICDPFQNWTKTNFPFVNKIKYILYIKIIKFDRTLTNKEHIFIAKFKYEVMLIKYNITIYTCPNNNNILGPTKYGKI